MKDHLTYRVSDEGEHNFSKAVSAAKKWIAANINGPLKLSYSISLKASCPEGDSVQEIASTEAMFDEDGRVKPKRRRQRMETDPEFEDDGK